MLLCLDRLMQTVRITTSGHDTSGELIDDEYLVILYHIVLVTEHEIMSTQCKDNIMLDLQVFCISKVFQLEEVLYLFHTLRSQINNLVFLVYDEISGLLDLHAHDSVHLVKLAAGFTALHLTCQNVTRLIKSG